MGAKQTKETSTSDEATTTQLNISNRHSDIPSSQFVSFRKRFFKSGFMDPRSPSQFFNRTPLYFDDANEKSFNLDDTFADLFIETRAKPTIVQILDDAKNNMDIVNNQLEDKETSLINNEFINEVEEVTPCSTVLTPILTSIGDKLIDPRSPNIDILRTPIIFDDDNGEAQDDAMENVLATLSINLSGSSTPKSTHMIGNFISTPTNKNLERAQIGKRPVVSKETIRQRIYSNDENAIPSTKSKLAKTYAVSPMKRTPLSCVKNQDLFRSRSVELFNK